jgi:hypothetical protein
MSVVTTERSQFDEVIARFADQKRVETLEQQERLRQEKENYQVGENAGVKWAMQADRRQLLNLEDYELNKNVRTHEPPIASESRAVACLCGCKGDPLRSLVPQNSRNDGMFEDFWKSLLGVGEPNHDVLCGFVRGALLQWCLIKGVAAERGVDLYA